MIDCAMQPTSLSPTPIGQGFQRNRWSSLSGCLVAATAIAVDVIAAKLYVADAVRLLIAFSAVVCLLVLAGDRALLGLTLRPVQPWSYWCRVTLLIAGLMLIPMGIVAALMALLDWQIAMPRTAPDEAPGAFVRMCIAAPVYEEALYRIVLCTPLVSVVGMRATVVVSGVVFGLLHVAYGNPGPDNLIAGFFLGWAFLKSGSIVVPLAWHSLGNGVALVAHVINWYAQ